MKYDPEKHHRRSIRLKGYDYSKAGWYFVTICTYNRESLFGNIDDAKMILNDAGKIVEKCWLEIPEHFPHAGLDEFTVMPNHIHGILIINNDNVGAKNLSPLQTQPQNKHGSFHSPSRTIGSIIRGFKTGVTKWIRKNSNVYLVWQRNYFERIIRDEQELKRIRRYIIENPLKWEDDKYYKH